VKKILGFDDSLDAFAVHGVGGIIGAMLTGIFASPSLGGLGLGDGNATIMSQLFAQFVSIIVTIAYSGILSYLILKGIDAVIGLRVSEEEEITGLDLSLHDERGYNL